MIRSEFAGARLVDETVDVDLSQPVAEREELPETFAEARVEAIDTLEDGELDGFVLAATTDWNRQTVIHGDPRPEFLGHGDLATAVVLQWIDRLLHDGLDREQARRMFEREMLARVEQHLEP